ncbi:MAG: MarR family winged helix-turn-helix transcriptional regulator [Solobacterium sp.]|jgi:DNA-binding MarR family transcriptional regulator|nr:MarR family winged helix-turn-helix transcriptional regulator [Solobacterium sp.]
MEMECGMLIKMVHDELEKSANNMLRNSDLTLAQIGVLMFISDQPEHIAPMKEIEHQLHVAQSTTTGIIMRMESKGFVETRDDVRDRRIKKVKITAKGLNACKNARKHMDMAEQNLLSPLNLKEQAELKDLLRKVAAGNQ